VALAGILGMSFAAPEKWQASSLDVLWNYGIGLVYWGVGIFRIFLWRFFHWRRIWVGTSDGTGMIRRIFGFIHAICTSIPRGRGALGRPALLLQDFENFSKVDRDTSRKAYSVLRVAVETSFDPVELCAKRKGPCYTVIKSSADGIGE
jgi:hypothetical protein